MMQIQFGVDKLGHPVTIFRQERLLAREIDVDEYCKFLNWYGYAMIRKAENTCVDGKITLIFDKQNFSFSKNFMLSLFKRTSKIMA